MTKYLYWQFLLICWCCVCRRVLCWSSVTVLQGLRCWLWTWLFLVCSWAGTADFKHSCCDRLYQHCRFWARKHDSCPLTYDPPRSPSQSANPPTISLSLFHPHIPASFSLLCFLTSPVFVLFLSWVNGLMWVQYFVEKQEEKALADFNRPNAPLLLLPPLVSCPAAPGSTYNPLIPSWPLFDYWECLLWHPLTKQQAAEGRLFGPKPKWEAVLQRIVCKSTAEFFHHLQVFIPFSHSSSRCHWFSWERLW